MANLVNYLDIQLRDMDYLKKYTRLEDKFLDPNEEYSGQDYIQGYEKALEGAKKVLKISSSQKVDWLDSDFYQILQKQYEERLAKEKAFIKAWSLYHKDKNINFTKIIFPPADLSQMKNISALKKYAESFSSFIKDATLENGDVIVAALRSEELARLVAGGMTSVVYSTNTVKQMIKKATQNNIATKDLDHEMYNFYEQLFNVFFFGPKGGKVYNGQNPETMVSYFQKKNKNNVSIAEGIFEQRFKDFIKKYYDDIAQKELDTFFNSDQLSITIDKTFQNMVLSKNQSGVFSFKGFSKDNVRGASESTQSQLKKMLEEMLRGVLTANKTPYEDFNRKMQGLIRIDEVFEQAESKYYKRVQISVEKEKSKRRKRLELKKKLRDRKTLDEEKIEALRLAYNDGLISYDEAVQGIVDMRHSNRAFELEIRSNFISLLIESILKLPKNFNIHGNFTKENIEILRQVTFKKIDGSTKTGKILLNSLSNYGYEQVKGLLGEIATAYAGKKAGIQNIQVTGSDVDRLKMQKHYDVVMEISAQRFGFQVKNFKEVKGKSYTLYRTDLSLGERAMYRYFPKDQVQTYRWLFANGKFLQTASNGIKDVREAMLSNFITQVPEFLRIRNAAEQDKLSQTIDSDIYVIGSKYYPSSYLIYKAYQIAYNNFKNVAAKNKLFKLNGDFPNYGYKMDPTKDIKGQKRETPKYSTMRKYKGNQISESPRNLVMLKNSHVLYGKKIIFSGITITL